MNLSLPWINTLVLISIRLSTVLLFSPIQAIRLAPIHARVLLVFIFALVFINYLPIPETSSSLFPGALLECANGIILSASLCACFAVFQIAGQIIDNQIGFNSIVLFNPAAHSQESLSSRLLSMLAVLFFFGVDGHLWLFKGLNHSFMLIPPGSLKLFSGFTPVIKQFAFMFSMAFMIASPIVLILLVIDLSCALITRTMPQLSTYFLSIPIKIILGLVVLHLILNYFARNSITVFSHCFEAWQELLS